MPILSTVFHNAWKIHTGTRGFFSRAADGNISLRLSAAQTWRIPETAKEKPLARRANSHKIYKFTVTRLFRQITVLMKPITDYSILSQLTPLAVRIFQAYLEGSKFIFNIFSWENEFLIKTFSPLAYHQSPVGLWHTCYLEFTNWCMGKRFFLKTLGQEIDVINVTDWCLHVITWSSKIETVSWSSFEARFTARDAKTYFS